MNKRQLIQAIIARLTESLQVLEKPARPSRAEATHESSKAENKYDTRGLEASYLARGQSRQITELKLAIADFEKLSGNDRAAGGPVDVGSLVKLSEGKERA